MKKPARKPRILVRDMLYAHSVSVPIDSVPKSNVLGFALRMVCAIIPCHGLPIYYN